MIGTAVCRCFVYRWVAVSALGRGRLQGVMYTLAGAIDLVGLKCFNSIYRLGLADIEFVICKEKV